MSQDARLTPPSRDALPEREGPAALKAARLAMLDTHRRRGENALNRRMVDARTGNTNKNSMLCSKRSARMLPGGSHKRPVGGPPDASLWPICCHPAAKSGQGAAIRRPDSCQGGVCGSAGRWTSRPPTASPRPVRQKQVRGRDDGAPVARSEPAVAMARSTREIHRINGDLRSSSGAPRKGFGNDRRALAR